jgi:microcystin-dependent protein
VAFNFAPRGWAECNGQILPINQNQALFALLGTTYGGNGTSNFALPDFRSRVAIHAGAGIGLSPYTAGQFAGVENQTLLLNELPAHNHGLESSDQTGTSSDPTAGVYATPNINPRSGTLYESTVEHLSAFSNNALTNAGGSEPHPNIQPYLALKYIIAIQGIFPST